MAYESLNGVEARLRVTGGDERFTPCPVVGGGGRLILVQVPRGLDQLPWVPEGTAIEVLKRDGLRSVQAVVRRRTLKPVPCYALQLQDSTLAAVVFRPEAGRSVLVAGGKGGVGKTFVAVSVALLLAKQGWGVLLVDADLGTPNVAVNLHLAADAHVGHLLAGRMTAEQVLQQEVRPRLAVMAGASGGSWSRPSRWRMGALVTLIRLMKSQYDFVVVDPGPGVGYDVTSLAAAADVGLFVTTDEPAAMADTLELVTSTFQSGFRGQGGLVLNQVRRYHESIDRIADLQHATRRRVGQPIPLISVVQDDPRVYSAALQSRPYVEALPISPTTTSLRQIAGHLQRCSVPAAASQS